jgi:hypothetical protein
MIYLYQKKTFGFQDRVSVILDGFLNYGFIAAIFTTVLVFNIFLIRGSGPRSF